MKKLHFTVDKVHIALAKRFWVTWNDNGYSGAPAIDLKRPYGNDYVLGDISEIYAKASDYEILTLDGGGTIILQGDQVISRDSEERFPASDMLMQYHRDMEIVVQILMHNVESGISEGEYVKESPYTGKWEKVSAVDS